MGEQRHRAWLDSASNPHSLGRYSYLAVDPWKILHGRGTQFWLKGQQLCSLSPWSVLQEEFQSGMDESSCDDDLLPPFRGGAIFLLGYELGRSLEKLPEPKSTDFFTPDIWVGWFDTIICWDHERAQAWIVSTGKSEIDPARRRERAELKINHLSQLIRHGPVSPKPRESVKEKALNPDQLIRVPLPRFTDLKVYSHFSRINFEGAVARAVEYIHAGDCFQVNIAQRLLARQDRPSDQLYLGLRRKNPAPFAGYLDLGTTQIISASPERFLRVGRGRVVETRPIKGTRPRGATQKLDDSLAQELKNSPKDRAENVMIVDLMRNDLGRVCDPGSIQVSEVCRLESYPTVHHLVSVVKGTLRQGKTSIDLLKATFPGGSVTGAPKIRSMEIITELEGVARGPYCGCLGWIGDDGQMDTNILIRTITANGGWLQFPVGGGIVADSIPEMEFEETLHKAEGLLKGLSLATVHQGEGIVPKP